MVPSFDAVPPMPSGTVLIVVVTNDCTSGMTRSQLQELAAHGAEVVRGSLPPPLPPVPVKVADEPPPPPRLPKPARAHGDRPLARVRMFNRRPRTFPRRYYARVARNTLGN